MAKVKHAKYVRSDGSVGKEQYLIFCPGCNDIHAMSPQIHSFNGDFDRPTFSPSLLMNFIPNKVCHSFVKDGKIQFLNDSWHKLKGQTVELPEINEDAV